MSGRPELLVIQKRKCAPWVRTISSAKELRELYGWSISDEEWERDFGVAAPFVAVLARAPKYGTGNPGEPITLTDAQLAEWRKEQE
jgi:hypothetical protein